MVQKLFELSSHAIRNAVINGEISSVSNLPLRLRLWIFKVFRMKQVLHDRNVIKVCRQPGFFDGFTSINMDEKNIGKCMRKLTVDAIDSCFLAFLTSRVKSNRHLAENLTELSLSFSPNCFYKCLNRRQLGCLLAENICELLSLCINLKRLHLIASSCSVPEYNGYHNFADSTVRLPPLEHLSVIGRNCKWNLERLPRQWFDSVRSLKMHEFDCDSELYSDILSRCQNTLTSLDLSAESMPADIFSPSSAKKFIPLPIALPVLRSLSITSCWSQPIIFEAIVNNCPNLTTAHVKMVVKEIRETDLVALAQLSDRLLLFVIVRSEPIKFSEFIRVVGKNIYGMKVSAPSFTDRYSDLILSQCTNLRILDLRDEEDESPRFVQRMLNDKDKAARLIELRLELALTEELLMTIFANCCNLRCLSLMGCVDESTGISSYLQTWLASGARPTSIDLRILHDLSPETVYSLFKASGPDLIHMRTAACATDDVHQMYLNLAANCCPFVESCVLDDSRPYERDVNAQLLPKYEKICFNREALNCILGF